MEILRSNCGLLGTNTFFVSFPSGEHYVIDAPDGNEVFIDRIKEETDSLSAILLTHGHFDHTDGLKSLLDAFPGTPIYLGKEDWYLMEEGGKGNKEIMGRISLPAGYWKEDNPEDFLPYGDQCGPFRILKTPGHTMGSVCLYVEEEKTLFSGDTLFQCGEGRTDFGGDDNAIRESIAMLLKLPEDTLVYPGHGGNTTIGREIQFR